MSAVSLAARSRSLGPRFCWAFWKVINITAEWAPNTYAVRSAVAPDSSRFRRTICAAQRSMLEDSSRDNCLTANQALRGWSQTSVARSESGLCFGRRGRRAASTRRCDGP